MEGWPDRRDRFLDAALEATCEAVLALELIAAGAIAEDAIERQLRGAVKSLRGAIDDLRRARDTHGHALAHGFVLAERPSALS